MPAPFAIGRHVTMARSQDGTGDGEGAARSQRSKQARARASCGEKAHPSRLEDSDIVTRSSFCTPR